MSIPSTTGNLCVYAGQNVPLNDTITKADGTPQDISSWSTEFAVFAYGDPATVYFRETSAGGGITYPNGGADGLLQVAGGRLAVDTAGMWPGEYGFAITRTDAYAVPTVGLLTVLAGPAP